MLIKALSLSFGVLSIILSQFGKVSLLFNLAALIFGGVALYSVKYIEGKSWIIMITLLGIFGVYRSIALFVLFSMRVN